MDLAAPGRRANSNECAGAKISAAKSIDSARIETVRARTAPRPVERLAIYSSHWHESRVSEATRVGSLAALHRAARAVDADARGRGVARTDRGARQYFSAGESALLGVKFSRLSAWPSL